jgi:hypothetical protein
VFSKDIRKAGDLASSEAQKLVVSCRARSQGGMNLLEHNHVMLIVQTRLRFARRQIPSLSDARLLSVLLSKSRGPYYASSTRTVESVYSVHLFHQVAHTHILALRIGRHGVILVLSARGYFEICMARAKPPY